jgi:hypothetical protein
MLPLLLGQLLSTTQSNATIFTFPCLNDSLVPGISLGTAATFYRRLLRRGVRIFLSPTFSQNQAAVSIPWMLPVSVPWNRGTGLSDPNNPFHFQAQAARAFITVSPYPCPSFTFLKYRTFVALR